jgi:hypothetical protein
MASRSRRKAGGNQGLPQSLKKWLFWGGFTALVCSIGGLLYGYQTVRSYLRSDEFRSKLSLKAGDYLKGGVEIQPFEWDGWTVSTDRFTFQSAEEFQNIEVKGVDALVDIGGIWDGVYRVKDVRVREVGFIQDPGQRPVGLRKPLPIEKETFFDRFMPDETEVTRISVAQAHGTVVLDQKAWSWDQVAAEMIPGANRGVYEISLQGGSVQTPFDVLGELELKEAKARVSGDRFYLLSSGIRVFESGRLSLDGDFGVEDGRWNLNGVLNGIRMEDVIAEDWKRRLIGPLELDFKAEQAPNQGAVIKGHLSMKNGILTALPVLDRIAAYANTERFRRLALSDASLDFSRRGEVIDLRNISITSEGLIRIEGAMTIVGNEITLGNFQVGITPGTLSHLPGAETKVFRPGDLGLLWTPLVITGTLDSPQEDLSDRLIAAAGQRMFEVLPETGQVALKYTGKAIGETTKAFLDQKGIILEIGKGLLDRTSHFLKQGADSALKSGENAVQTGQGALETGKAAVEGVGHFFNIFGGAQKKEK